MCLVAFQKKFRKIFSSVWKRRRKRQNPEKHGQNPKKKSSNPVKLREARETGDWVRRGARLHSGGEGEIGAVLREIAISQSTALIAISRSIDRDRRDRCLARSFFLSFVLPLRVCELSLRVSVLEIIWSENRNGNEFPWSTLLFYGQLKMISGKFYFQNQPNNLFYGKWFLETIFTQNKHTLKLSLD